MRVALIGYSSVAGIHARVLTAYAEVVTVYGPDQEKAAAFARLHRIPNADTDLDKALSRSDAAVICSPSPVHFEQGFKALENGLNVLIELPACTSPEEARALAARAEQRHVVLQCAHTSRYVESYRRIGAWLQDGVLGDIRQIHYVRWIAPRVRSWTDDALFHHAEHPLDLFLKWFGAVDALACAAHPGIPGAQDISLTATVGGKVPLAVSISYTARLPELKMTIMGSKHTIATDGFTYIASDDTGLTWRGDEQPIYERAIEEQDAEFLRACTGGEGGIPWQETIRLTNCISEFANLWRRN